MVDLTVIILTKNEEANIVTSVTNVVSWAKYVYILDSWSDDKTCDIAKSLGTQVFYNRFENYAQQRNYAIKQLPIKTDWILFLDADEYLTAELKNEVAQILPFTQFDGFYLKRRFYFMNKWIKHGGYYPTWILRLFKREKATVVRDINEYIDVNGTAGYLNNYFVDDNKKSTTDWIEKHNKYATYEAMELIKEESKKKTGSTDDFAKFFGSQPQRKRWVREHIWNRLPLFTRPFLFFCYRYFIRFGFIDGKEGFIYHYLHAFWYRFLIDVKYLELRHKIITKE